MAAGAVVQVPGARVGFQTLNLIGSVSAAFINLGTGVVASGAVVQGTNVLMSRGVTGRTTAHTRSGGPRLRSFIKATGNLRAVQILPGHTKIESTVRYLGVGMPSPAEATEV